MLHKNPIYLLIAAFCLLGLFYIYATPVFEAPDELYHTALIHRIANVGALPVQKPGKYAPWKQEGSQPPLYHMLSAGLVTLLDRSDYRRISDDNVNPHAVIGSPAEDGNKNRVLHTTVYPPPLHGAALAVYINRLFSLALGAVTVFAVYGTARVAVPETPGVALFAAGLTAFNPQFLFISAAVNNDNLVTALNSLVLWQALVMLRSGFQTRRSLVIAVLVALATVSKWSGFIPVVGVAAVALYVAWQRRDLRGLVTLVGVGVGAWVLLAGWWYLRNLTLYGELLGTSTMLDIFGRREPPPLPQLLTELRSLTVSYWGLFGWFSIYTFQPFYTAVEAGLIAAGAGIVVALWRNRQQRVTMAVLLLVTGSGFISLVMWTLQTAGTQGRLLFPFTAATSTLLALGLTALFTLRARWLLLPLGVTAMVIPFATIIPAYAPPPALAALPETAQPVNARFDDIGLAGYSLPQQRYYPGDTVPITLYWQPGAQSAVDYTLYVHLVDAQNNVITKIDTYPGWGSLATTRWQPQTVYADTYRLKLPRDLVGAFALRVRVGWWVYPEGRYLKAVDPNDTTLDAVSLPAGGFVNPAATLPPAFDPAAYHFVNPVGFGDVIALHGYHIEAGTLDLLWEAVADPGEDYTVMVYAADDDLNIDAQGDAAPDLPTRYWRRGERYVTHHTFNPQRCDVTVFVGWYNTARRLSVAAPGNAYPLYQPCVNE